MKPLCETLVHTDLYGVSNSQLGISKVSLYCTFGLIVPVLEAVNRWVVHVIFGS